MVRYVMIVKKPIINIEPNNFIIKDKIKKGPI